MDVERIDSKDIMDELKGLGIRPSSARVLVLKYLRERKNHPTIDQVYGEITGNLPGLSRMSVYNSMNVLAENGLVRSLSMEGGETRYDATTKNHGHFKCEGCGAIYDFDLGRLATEKRLPAGFQAERQDLLVWGLCAHCAENSITHNCKSS
jgi:Fe2+ or Zn2+ uptake regulation protein